MLFIGSPEVLRLSEITEPQRTTEVSTVVDRSEFSHRVTAPSTHNIPQTTATMRIHLPMTAWFLLMDFLSCW